MIPEARLLAFSAALLFLVSSLAGVNAMVFAGGAGQRAASTLGLASSTSIIVGWSALLVGWVTP